MAANVALPGASRSSQAAWLPDVILGLPRAWEDSKPLQRSDELLNGVERHAIRAQTRTRKVPMTTLTSEDREVIRRATEEHWTAAVVARDWNKVLEMCADDVVYMPADHPVLRGQAALRAWFDQFPRLVEFSQPLETVEGQGELAMSRCSFAVALDIAGTPIANTGKVLCAWQRDESGRWLVKAVCWNWDRPVSGGA